MGIASNIGRFIATTFLQCRLIPLCFFKHPPQSSAPWYFSASASMRIESFGGFYFLQPATHANRSLHALSTVDDSNIHPVNVDVDAGLDNMLDKQQWKAIDGALQQFGCSPYLEKAMDELDLTLNYPLVKGVLEKCGISDKVAFRFFLWAARQPSYEPTLDIYHTVAHILIDSGRLNVSGLLSLMMEMRHDGCAITPKGIVVVMNILGYAGMDAYALEAFDRITSLCCKPTAPAYNALLSVLCKAFKMEIAEQVFHRMVRSGCVPNAMTFTLLIDGYCKCGDLKEALWYMKMATKRGAFPPPETIAMVVNKMCREGTVDRAANLLYKLAERGCSLNASAFNTLIRKYCQFRKVEEALQTSEKMEKLGLYSDPVTYNLLIKLFAPYLEKVRDIMATMTSKGLAHDAHTFHGFIDALCRRRRLKEACGVLDEMLKNNCTPNVGTYTLLIVALCTVKRSNDALILFRDMEKRAVVPNNEMFTALIRGLCKEGNIDEALKLFNQLNEMNIIPSIGTYRIVEKGLIKAHRKEEAQKLLDWMLAKGYNQKLRLHVSKKTL